MSKKIQLILSIAFLFVTMNYAQQIIDFSEWSGNYLITGSNTFDSFASSMVSGDIDGDNIEDIIVGAYSADPNGRNSAGCLYIFYGSSGLPQQSEINADNADVTCWGAVSNDQLGTKVAVGNINNDIYDDILVSAPYATYDDREQSGIVYIILGGPDLDALYDLSTSTYPSKIFGETQNDFLGQSLMIGNINGDSYDDLIIGTPNADHASINCGKTYVIFGELPAIEYDLANPADVDLTFIGEETNDNSGMSLTVGNFNGDLYNDLLIGSPFANYSGRPDAGKLYMIEGRTTFPVSIIELGTSPYVDLKIFGAHSESMIGLSIAAGDINSDDKYDIFFTDFAENDAAGEVNIFYGSNAFPSEIDQFETPSDISIFGGSYNGFLGETLFSYDLNNDDFDEILIGIPRAIIPNGEEAGLVYLINGNEIIPSEIDLESYTPDIIYYGAAAGERLGSSLTVLDFNQDPVKDICLGASGGSNDVGAVYTVFGDIPYVINKIPHDEQGGVDVSTNVTFDLIDEIDGIDLASILVLIAGTEYNSESLEFNSSGNVNSIHITINPAVNFGYNQTVDVSIDCSDLSGWQMPTESYRFYTRADTDAPYVDQRIPEHLSTGNLVTSNVTFHVRDNGEGVNIDSLKVRIEGTEYIPGSQYLTYTGDPNDYYVIIDPPGDFDYGQTVNVEIDAIDMADNPNAMATNVYEFYCSEDVNPPIVISWFPDNGSDAPINTDIDLEIVDFETGVDSTTLSVYLDDVIIQPDQLIPNISGNGYYFHYEQEIPYLDEGSHEIRVTCADFANPVPNEADTTIVFNCVSDADPPYTDNHFPAQLENDVASNTLFEIDILDDLMGVDQASIIIIVDGQSIMGLPNTTVETIELGFHIIYEADYNLLGTINVSIDADDLANNSMATEEYYFICTLDVDAPYLANLNPDDEQTNIPVDTSIFFEIYDDKTGVNPETITLYVNGEEVITIPQPIDGGFSVNYFPLANFAYNEEINIRIICNDQAANPNQLDESYFFYIEGDSDPPYLQNLNPDENEIGIPLNTDIYLEIVDDGLGVNEQSIQLYIDGLPVAPVITPLIVEIGFSLLYNPPANYDFSQIVQVSGYASDNAPVPNQLSFQYSFRCADDDEIPPFIRGENPSPGALDVSVHNIISFEILDAETGVDSNSIDLRINNTIIENFNLTAVSYDDTTGFYLFYEPPVPFQYGETVIVQIYAIDSSSNYNEVLKTYSFTCESDNVPPEIVEMYPLPSGNGYPKPIIFFHFTDPKSGINAGTMFFKIDDQTTTPDSAFFIEQDYYIYYQPEELYDNGDIVNLHIEIDDLIGNHFSLDYSFDVVNEPPIIMEAFPQPGGVGFQNSIIYFHFSDTIAIMDSTTFEFTVNDVKIDTSLYEHFMDDENYYITYDPPNPLPDGRIDIGILLYDFYGNHLGEPDNFYQYFFTIVPDDFNPYLYPIEPLIGSSNSMIDSTVITVDILDKGMGIDEQSIDFYVFGQLISPTNYHLESYPYGFNPDSLGFRLIHTLDAQKFFPGQQIAIRIAAEDIHQPPNYLDETYTFYLFKDITQKNVTVIPSTLTLNNDNYNDECRIVIPTSVAASDIECRIFNRRGRLIDTLEVFERSTEEKYAIWDGKINENFFVNGGLYIYQVKIGKEIYQGSIVVAK